MPPEAASGFPGFLFSPSFAGKTRDLGLATSENPFAQSHGAVMNKKVAGLSLLGLGLSLSACLAGPIDETGDGESIAEVESKLNGGPWTWVNSATLLCLDSNGSGSVYAQGCNGGSYQKWTNTQFSYGDQIRNLATGLCLDSNISGNVYALPCNGGSYQQWAVTYKGTFGYELRNVATGLCLDSNGNGSVYAQGCNGGNYQRWK
jgi:serine/threonine-protein kinase